MDMDKSPLLRLHWIHTLSRRCQISPIDGRQAVAYLDGEVSAAKGCNSFSRGQLSSERTPVATVQNNHLVVWDSDAGQQYVEIPLLFARVACATDSANCSELIILTEPSEDPFLPLVEMPCVWIFVLNHCIANASARALRTLGSCGALQQSLPPYIIQREVLATGATATLHLGLPVDGPQVVSKLSLQRHGEAQVIFKSFTFGEDKKSLWRLSELRRELSCLLSLQGHQNIVQFQGIFMTGLGSLSIQMNYCVGGDLFDAVVKGSVFQEQEAQSIMLGLMQALEFVHKRGYVHRDVTSQNVLLGNDGRPILADFGLCAHLSDQLEMSAKRGSPGYAAPEVWCGFKYDTRADCFSAGSVLFFILSRKLPFEAKSVEAMLKNMMTNDVSFAKLPQFSDVSDECKDFICCLLQKDPAYRPTSTVSLAHYWLTRDSERTSMESYGNSTVDFPYFLPQESDIMLSGILLEESMRKSEKQVMQMARQRALMGRLQSPVPESGQPTRKFEFRKLKRTN